ncbi:unnamed protein product [Phytophthora fragariaefolia]|uniref:Unnamed protein product n=1 Tax=Phytophthora fragariaefolia TaxID=1490495 RepID=A0A9W6XGK1_9STRA|nr:unnamed protein product [Phytophthora fragariaefolia]
MMAVVEQVVVLAADRVQRRHSDHDTAQQSQLAAEVLKALLAHGSVVAVHAGERRLQERAALEPHVVVWDGVESHHRHREEADPAVVLDSVRVVDAHGDHPERVARGGDDQQREAQHGVEAEDHAHESEHGRAIRGVGLHEVDVVARENRGEPNGVESEEDQRADGLGVRDVDGADKNLALEEAHDGAVRSGGHWRQRVPQREGDAADHEGQADEHVVDHELDDLAVAADPLGVLDRGAEEHVELVAEADAVLGQLVEDDGEDDDGGADGDREEGPRLVVLVHGRAVHEGRGELRRLAGHVGAAHAEREELALAAAAVPVGAVARGGLAQVERVGRRVQHVAVHREVHHAASLASVRRGSRSVGQPAVRQFATAAVEPVPLLS